MVDNVSESRRSYLMSRVKSSDTRPEKVVRSMLHRRGFRFTLRGPKNRRLPGRPDLVLPAREAVIFVHGCFWHGHEGCRDYRLPKSRTAWWQEKIEANRSRDLRHWRELPALGWSVAIVWTCALSTAASREFTAEALENFLTRRRIQPVVLEIEDSRGTGCRCLRPPISD
jgi:DNA mismatch endonuclease, patch repair protein